MAPVRVRRPRSRRNSKEQDVARVSNSTKSEQALMGQCQGYVLVHIPVAIYGDPKVVGRPFALPYPHEVTGDKARVKQRGLAKRKDRGEAT